MQGDIFHLIEIVLAFVYYVQKRKCWLLLKKKDPILLILSATRLKARLCR